MSEETEVEPGSQEHFERVLQRCRIAVVATAYVSAAVSWFFAAIFFTEQPPYKERVAEVIQELWCCLKTGFMLGFASGRFENERRLAIMRLEQRHPELRLPAGAPDGTGP